MMRREDHRNVAKEVADVGKWESHASSTTIMSARIGVGFMTIGGMGGKKNRRVKKG